MHADMADHVLPEMLDGRSVGFRLARDGVGHVPVNSRVDAPLVLLGFRLLLVRPGDHAVGPSVPVPAPTEAGDVGPVVAALPKRPTARS